MPDDSVSSSARGRGAAALAGHDGAPWADRGWLVAACYLGASLITTWPLAARLATHLLQGSLTSATVPLFNLWILEWNASSLARGYAGYWDAPIFHPASDTFALSEPQALPGLAFAALSPLTGSVVAYNLCLLAALVLNALATRRLARRLGAPPMAAGTAGLLAFGLPFVWKELGVLQLLALWPMIFALAELAQLAIAPRPGALVRLACCGAALLWTCIYYALFMSVLAPILALGCLRRELFAAPMLRALVGSCLLLGAAAAPLVIVEQRAIATRTRSDRAIQQGAATLGAYRRLPRGAAGGALLPALAGRPGGRSLYPGTLLIALALIALLPDLRRRSRVPGRAGSSRSARAEPDRIAAEPDDPARSSAGAPARVEPAGPSFGARERQARRVRRFLGWCGVAAAVAFALSFGTRLAIGELRPYEQIMQAHWPGFAQLRSPYRFAAVVQVLLLAFACVGLARLHAACLRRWGRSWPLALVALAVWLEVVPWNAALARFPAEALARAWVERLARERDQGALALVPPAASGKADDYEPIVVGMLQGLRHGHPLTNGYSGFFPPAADELDRALQAFPDARALRGLRKIGARYVVVDKLRLPLPAADRLETSGYRLVRFFDSETHALYRRE